MGFSDDQLAFLVVEEFPESSDKPPAHLAGRLPKCLEYPLLPLLPGVATPGAAAVLLAVAANVWSRAYRADAKGRFAPAHVDSPQHPQPYGVNQVYPFLTGNPYEGEHNQLRY